MNRRELLLGAAGAASSVAAFRGFDVPKTETKTECVLWLVLQGGTCHDAQGLEDTKVMRGRAAVIGFEVLDTMHVATEISRILVRKPMTVERALAIEEALLGGCMKETGRYREICALFPHAMWIEYVK